MSLQTITDFVSSSPKLQDFQKSLKLEPLDYSINFSSSLQSFKDLVSSYSEIKGIQENFSSSSVEKNENKSLENENLNVKREENLFQKDNFSDSKEVKETENIKESGKTEEREEPSNEKSNVPLDSKDSLKIQVFEENFEDFYETKFNSDEKSLSSEDNKTKIWKKSFKDKSEALNENLDEKDFRLENLNSSEKIEVNSSLHFGENKSLESVNEITLDVSLGEEIKLGFKKENTENNFENFIQKQNLNEEVELSFDEEDKKSLNNEKSILFLDKEEKIFVQDFRTKSVAESSGEYKSDSASRNLLNSDAFENNYLQTALTNADVLSSNSQSASANGSDFQAMLSNQIQMNASEIVKSGSIILKDNNQGTINLVLHPDDLGNVKIHLSMDGKTLSGHIAVSSKEALQVFKDNAETLREAFIKNGFDVSSFDVSLNNGSFSDRKDNSFSAEENSRMLGLKIYNSYSEKSNDAGRSIVENFLENSNYSINIVA